MKPQAPYQIWNEAVDMTGYGQSASANDAASLLKKLRAELGKDFDIEFRLRMVTARANTFEQLIGDWVHERTRIRV